MNKNIKINNLAAIFSRQAIKSHKIGDIYIHKGTVVNIGITENHYNPEFFKNPFEFNPERWLKTDVELPPFVFNPFSGGVRSCIGKNLALDMAKIIIIELVEL